MPMALDEMNAIDAKIDTARTAIAAALAGEQVAVGEGNQND